MTEILASIKLFIELLGQAKALWKFYQDNKTEAWFQDATKTFAELKTAQTTEEKKHAVANLVDLWSRV